MAFMAAVPAITMAGMAMSAAGAAASYATERARQAEMDQIRKNAAALVRKNQEQATARWKQALEGASPEEQTKMRAEQTAKLGTAMQNVAEGTTEPSIVTTTDQSPKIVASETAKQLGQALDEAKNQMAAQASLGGWSMTPDLVAQDLMRSAGDIGTYANFTQGNINAMNTDLQNAATAQPTVPVGDILKGVGQAGMAIGGNPKLGDKLFGVGNWMTMPVGDIGPVNRLASGTPVAGDMSHIF
jgi:hypothetical protein